MLLIILLNHDESFNPGQILSNKEKGALKKLITAKNKVICVDDMDTNLGGATADKHDGTKECRRQLYDQSTYLKLSEDAKNALIRSIKFQLQ